MTSIDVLDLVGKYAGTAVTTFVAGLAGAYLGSYVKKSAENKAIRENLGKLVHQMSAVTLATEQIKASISDDVWARQRRWELRRDIMLQAMDHVSELQGGLTALTAAAVSLEA